MRPATMLARTLVAAGALALAAVPARAQEIVPSAWSAALYYDLQQLSSGPERYGQTLTASVLRRAERGSLAVQAIGTRRFELEDRALGVDAYHDLWPGAYGNAYVQWSPDGAVLPELIAGAELFQGVGNAELAPGYRRQRYATADVTTLGLGLGYYAGAWYLRQRTQLAEVGGEWSPYFTATARRYLNESTTDSYDVSLGLGEEVLDIAPATGSGAVQVITTRARFAAVRTQRSLTPHLGVLLGASYNDYASIPNRWGATVGVVTRW